MARHRERGEKRYVGESQDQVLATGEPVEIERNGRTMRFEAAHGGSPLDRLVPLAGDIIGERSEDHRQRAGRTDGRTRGVGLGGAGVVKGIYGIATYINPDTIAAGFGVASVDEVAFDAGRIALNAVDDCIARGVDFAFETTLSGRRWPRLLDRLGAAGYDTFLHYLWIPGASQCVARVAHRVSVGGHGVREVDIRRRHVSSIENYITMFMPRVNEWFVHDASKDELNTIASGTPSGGLLRVVDIGAWRAFTARGRRDIAREVAVHGYQLTPTRERSMDKDQLTTTRSDDEAALDSLDRTSELVMAASRIAVRRALAIHRALGVGAAFWEDGKVVLVPPDELPRDVNDVKWAERRIAQRERRRLTKKG